MQTISTDTIRELDADTGHYFFSAGAMRSFSSRVSDDAAVLPNGEGWLFVTSERMHWDQPRLYSVRWAKPSGQIRTIEHQAHSTSRQAWGAIRRMVSQWPVARPVPWPELISQAAEADVTEGEERNVIAKYGTPEQKRAYGIT